MSSTPTYYDDSDDEYDEYEMDEDCKLSPSKAMAGLTNSPQCPHTPRRNSFRNLPKSLVSALASPVKMARNTISPANNSKSKIGSLRKPKSFRKTKQDKTWQEEYDLPPNTSREEAMAILLCRELELMDL
eukprot:Nitzschia sp. Nitz4//scaffold15_size197535//14841//15230//NITZ4_001550-RA/size197535-processed-gene-0.280-mRNA-1//-1//CDS//3329537631//1137//frame0